MGLQTENRFDRLLMTFSILGAVMFGTALWNDDWLINHFIGRVNSGEAIGEVLSAKNDARRRTNRSLTWLQAHKNEKLFERDTIFTGKESEINIKIGKENKLTLQENSLIVLQTQGNEILLDLQIGSMSTDFLAAGQTIKVFQSGKVAAIKSTASRVHLSRSNSGVLNVMSQTGDVEVNIGESKTTLKKDEQLKIEKNLSTSKQEYSARFTSHQLNEKVWVAREDSVSFEWTEDKVTAKDRMQISKSSQFFKSKLVVDTLTIDRKFLWNNLSEGVYYYRIVDDATLVSNSVVQKLDVFLSEPIQLIRPTEDEVLLDDESIQNKKAHPIQFTWGTRRGVDKYLIQIYRDEGLTDELASKQVDNIIGKQNESTGGHSYTIMSVPSGTYYWRVSSLQPDNKNLMSQVRKFTVGGLALPEISLRFHGPDRPLSNFNSEQAPVAEFAKNSIELEFADQVDVRSPASIEKNLKNPPEFKWAPKDGSVTYKIEIDRTKEFSAPIVIDGLNEPKYVWRGAVPGQYYWRVKAKNSEGIESQSSQPNQLLVRLSAPRLKADELKDEKTTNLADMKKTKAAQLKWGAIPYAKNYLVVVGGSSRTISSEKFTLQVKPNIETKIKVAAANSKGEPIGRYAEHTFKFNKTLLLKTPEILMPSDNTTVVAFSEDRIDPIVFAWKGAPGYKQYEIQFARDADFSQVIAVKKNMGSKFVLKEKLSDGLIYWRVRALVNENTSEWSEARSYEMQIATERE